MSQTKLPGYRELGPVQLKLMKENKLLEEIVLRQLDRHAAADQNVDQRWIAIARTQLQQGFMALSRAVAQPQRLRPTTEVIEGFAVDVERLVDELIRS